MHRFLKSIKFLLEFIRCSLHLAVFHLSKNRRIIRVDIIRWLQLLDIHHNPTVGLVYLLGFKKPFRNIFYYRIGEIKHLLNIICPKESTLVMATDYIDEGLYILHGYSTAIGAKSIGKNCSISQQVTIGNINGAPTILDNVVINAGAIVVGDITIGNNVVVGANATVISDVPDNCTVYPAQSRVMKWKKGSCKK